MPNYNVINAKAALDKINEFANSDIRVFIEQMVAKDKDYFTEEKINEVNEFLNGSGWEFCGKITKTQPENGEHHEAAFGPKLEYCFFNDSLLLWYALGNFDLDDDIKRVQNEYERAVERNRKYEEAVESKREYWRKKISELSQDELIEILVEEDMRYYDYYD